jgi:hypothetical protein
MSETSLKRWAAVDEGEAMPQAAAFVRLQVAGRAVGTGLVVEVGRARVRVEPGFDGQLLRAVVAALATEATP